MNRKIALPTKTVSTAEFIRHFGRYHDEAQREPIALTKHGRNSVVVLSAEKYDRLISGSDPRRAYGPGETPSELAALLLSELDRQSAEYLGGKDE
jgi:prevent-host-death family protein